MARILFTWELGSGMGHVAPYLSLANGLRDKGHDVAFVLRDLLFAEISLGQHDFPYYQAPVVLNAVDNKIPNVYTFSQMLHNVGYGNIELLTGLAKAWRQLFYSYRPDLIIYEHSPTALLASRAIECKKIVIGSGFFIPPDVTPLPVIRSHPEPNKAVLVADEARVLANINRVLNSLGSKPVDRIAQLYDVDEKILTTFKELDTYRTFRQQGDTSYWGISRSALGAAPVWPQGQGKCIYAYLQPFKHLPEFLQYLQQLKASIIIYAPGVSDAIKQEFTSQTLCFAQSPLDLEQVASSCDVAITNGNHTTTASFLQAGKPLLLLPVYHEQSIVAHNVERIGAGLVLLSHRPQEIITKLQVLMDNPRFRLAAESFAKQYTDFDVAIMEQRLIDHVDGLLTTS